MYVFVVLGKFSFTLGRYVYYGIEQSLKRYIWELFNQKEMHVRNVVI